MICINNFSLIAFVFHTDSGQLPPLGDEQHHNEYSQAVHGYYQHQGANWSAAGTTGRASSFWCAANGRNSISAYTFWDSQVGDPVELSSIHSFISVHIPIRMPALTWNHSS